MKIERHLLGKQALYSKQTLFVFRLLASFLAFRKRKLLRIFIRLKYFDILSKRRRRNPEKAVAFEEEEPQA